MVQMINFSTDSQNKKITSRRIQCVPTDNVNIYLMSDYKIQTCLLVRALHSLLEEYRVRKLKANFKKKKRKKKRKKKKEKKNNKEKPKHTFTTVHCVYIPAFFLTILLESFVCLFF